jgi:hypothetical protein
VLAFKKMMRFIVRRQVIPPPLYHWAMEVMPYLKCCLDGNVCRVLYIAQFSFSPSLYMALKYLDEMFG